MTTGPLAGVRVGYVPYGPTFSAPADRRRFHRYARRRGVEFEIARPGGTYDVVVLSQRADVTAWARQPRNRARLVYDFIDSYLAIPSRGVKARLRGLAKFATRQHSRFVPDYRSALEAMCRRADAVICSTDEQQAAILRFCPDVHQILDIHTEDVRLVKKDYAAGPVFNFVWEGLGPGSSTYLRLLRDILAPVAATRPIALHLLTDLTYGHFHGRYYQRSIVDDVRRIFGRWADRVFPYQWNQEMFAVLATACDVALLPIPDRPFEAGKPENKLLLLWRLGLPVLTSATPAYARAMRMAAVPMACAAPEDWARALDTYVRDEEARRDAAARGRAHAERHHGEEIILERWDRVFASVLAR